MIPTRSCAVPHHQLRRARSGQAVHGCLSEGRHDVFIGGSFSNHLVADEEQRFLIELAEALPLPPDRARRIVDVFTILKLDALRDPSPQSAGVG